MQSYLQNQQPNKLHQRRFFNCPFCALLAQTFNFKNRAFHGLDSQQVARLLRVRPKSKIEMANQRETFKYLAIVCLCFMAIALGPWDSDLLGSVFSQEVKNYIIFASFIASLSFFLGYLKAERLGASKFTKHGNRLYSNDALEQLQSNGISIESIENIIANGTQTKRSKSNKYSGNVGSKTVLVYTNLNNAVTDVVL